MPYFMLKTALRISNPVGMIRSKPAVRDLSVSDMPEGPLTVSVLGIVRCT
jgi:hypothetical protein